MIYEYTGATLKFQTGNTSFEMVVKQAKGYSCKSSEYVVYIKQTTKVNDIEGCEECEDFKCTYKCVCLDSPTEHSAIHFAGRKYIKNWNTRHRIGKDYPLI